MSVTARLHSLFTSRRVRLAGVVAMVGAATVVTAAPGAGVARAVSEDLLGDSLVGTSGKLRARFVTRTRAFAIPLLRTLFGDSPARQPGVYAVPLAESARPFSFISMRPFSDKVNGRIGGYRIGFWPGEPRVVQASIFPLFTRRGHALPHGFIEV
nr:hypothetical protein [Gemmatimonadaceae bacterium]